MGAGVAVDGDLVVADQVLAVVEELECGADPMSNRIETLEDLGVPSWPVASGRKTWPRSGQSLVSSARQ